MPFLSIKKLLHQKIGLNSQSIGDSSIERALKHRLAITKVGTVKQYYELILQDADEFTGLVEEVVVPETWFFRNNSPFEAFTDYVTKTIAPNLKGDEKLRVLSVPCSTGEEPYSIAICLQRAGVDLKKVEIHAVDISKRALTKAKRAIYGKNSFRGDDLILKEEYFTKGGAGYRLNDEIRDVVTFKQANFLNASLSPESEYYHAIFCRNLLIYFDRQTQQMALEKLDRALKERGALFVGHAEASQVKRKCFVKLYSARSFGYVKVHESSSRKKARKSKSPRHVPDQWVSVFDQLSKLSEEKSAVIVSKEIKQNEKTAISKNKYSGKPKNVNDTSSEILMPKISLVSIERLANKGKYQEAIELCKTYLKQTPDSADAYYLLGLVTDLNGSPAEADILLRKSIYLNPNHEQALLLASLLAEKRGEIDAALSYKRRAKRVSDRKPDSSSVA